MASDTAASFESTEKQERFVFHSVIDSIDQMHWQSLTSDDVARVAKAYFYFSVQFRENLACALALYPDPRLAELWAGECDTTNLSPWPGVAAVGERLDHDEFMRRLLFHHPVVHDHALTQYGQHYLTRVRAIDDRVRAMSIASYEDGGLSTVFSAMLRAPDWNGKTQRAFRFFLRAHIGFDGDGGHGLLSRCIPIDDRILPLWIMFRDLLAFAVPKLTG